MRIRIPLTQINDSAQSLVLLWDAKHRGSLCSWCGIPPARCHVLVYFVPKLFPEVVRTAGHVIRVSLVLLNERDLVFHFSLGWKYRLRFLEEVFIPLEPSFS